MPRLLAFLMLIVHLGTALAQGAGNASPAATSASATPAPAVATSPAPSPRLDPVAATEAYLGRIPAADRERSDNYAEGGYWLLLWNLLYGLLVALVLLRARISERMRAFAERRTRRRNVQALIYALIYVPLVALLTLPLTFYQEFLREHQYGLSNLSLAAWLTQGMIGLAVNTVTLAAAITGIYALLRRFPRSWLAWATLAGTAFMMVMMMIGPVYIAPLFNDYKPLPAGPVRDDIMSLARANGIPASDVYYFDASKQTKRVSANVSGLFGTTRISLNDNLLNRTPPAGIRAVMAHEMGHYVASHVFWFTAVFTIIFMGGLLFVRASWNWAVRGLARGSGVRDISDPAGLPLMVALLSIYLFVLTPVTNTITRTAETEADIFGLNAAREPDGFAEVVLQLAEYRKLHPGPVEEFVFFDHPSGYSRIIAAMRWKAENPR